MYASSITSLNWRFLIPRAWQACVALLAETGRVPEAAFMARTYCPSMVTEAVAAWRADLGKVNKKAAEALFIVAVPPACTPAAALPAS